MADEALDLGADGVGGDPPDAFDSLDPAERERLLAAVPAGAVALAGLTVVLLLIGWFGLYFLVYLPRGS